MPFSRTIRGSHDDTDHYGSAKRDVAGGVAGLAAGGDLLVLGDAIYIARSGGNQVLVYERTSNELAAFLTRSGVNTYAGFIRESAADKRIQTESMKNVASGIAGLDASARIAQAQLPLLTVYANNAATLVGGLVVGNFYRNGADPDMVCVVH